MKKILKDSKVHPQTISVSLKNKGVIKIEQVFAVEGKTEQVFACCQYSEAEKVKVAALEFKDHAQIWWDQEKKYSKRFNETLMATWLEMKTLMRKRYVPREYQRKHIEEKRKRRANERDVRLGWRTKQKREDISTSAKLTTSYSSN